MSRFHDSRKIATAFAFHGMLVLAALFATRAWAAEGPKETDRETLYALGVAMSQSIRSLGFTPAEFEAVKEGLTDGALHRPLKVDMEKYRPLVAELVHSRQAVAAAAERKAGAEYLAKAAGASGAIKTTSGAIVQTIKAGSGASPGPADTVTVHYVGTLIDGTQFDSSKQHGGPATLSLGRVIKCWTEGLQKMKVGGKSRLVCPAEIAYGERGAPPVIKPGATLVFEIELLGIGEKK
jgi:FKBP-type peptidyl-prolyl cis-trans isomerase FkpA